MIPKSRHAVILKLVARQAEDDGLWFMAETAPEAYLQQELRKLHAVIEGDDAAFAAITRQWELDRE